jgi:hypothetical protein
VGGGIDNAGGTLTLIHTEVSYNTADIDPNLAGAS